VVLGELSDAVHVLEFPELGELLPVAHDAEPSPVEPKLQLKVVLRFPSVAKEQVSSLPFETYIAVPKPKIRLTEVLQVKGVAPLTSEEITLSG